MTQSTSELIRLKKENEVLKKELLGQKELFEKIFSYTPIVIYEGDQNWGTVNVNCHIEILTGYSQDDFLHNKIKWIDLIHKDDFEKVKRDASILGEKSYTLTQIYRIRHKDGRIVWVEDTKSSYFKDGVYHSLQGVVKDITDRKEVEAKKILTNQLEIVGQLAGGIAHDYNNILVSIFGSVDLLLLENNLQTNQLTLLKKLKDAALKASQLSNQLLTFAKGGTPVMEVKKIDPILENVVKLSMHGSNSSYKMVIEENLPTVLIDETQISVALSNIIINGLQSMKNGGVLKISASKKNISKHIILADGFYIEICIHDHGCGIPVSNKEKVFTPYFSTKVDGKGMGLATAFSIIRQHDGLISFQSEPGIGTSFYIHLPQFISNFLPTDIVKPQEFILQETDISNLTILIMDDNENIHHTIRLMCERLNDIKVISTYDGNETIKKMTNIGDNTPKVDIIIMDLTIPGGMGGKKTIKMLRSEFKQVKVIVSSGYSADRVMSQYKNYGFDAVLPKPFTFDEFKQVIAKVMKYR